MQTWKASFVSLGNKTETQMYLLIHLVPAAEPAG